jgi:hypothetical protein
MSGRTAKLFNRGEKERREWKGRNRWRLLVFNVMSGASAPRVVEQRPVANQQLMEIK